MQKKKFTILDAIFIVAILAVTIAMVFVVINIFKNNKAVTFDSIEEITVEDYLNKADKDTTTYFVYFYSSEVNDNFTGSIYKNELITFDLVETYKRIKDEKIKTNLYKIDVSKDINKTYTSVISSVDNIPALVVIDVSNNTSHVHEKITDVTKIISEFNEHLDELKK